MHLGWLQLNGSSITASTPTTSQSQVTWMSVQIFQTISSLSKVCARSNDICARPCWVTGLTRMGWMSGHSDPGRCPWPPKSNQFIGWIKFDVCASFGVKLTKGRDIWKDNACHQHQSDHVKESSYSSMKNRLFDYRVISKLHVYFCLFINITLMV